MPDGLGWLIPLFRYIIGFGFPVVWSGYLLKKIFAHSICLSGQRVSNARDPNSIYRFALQNNEEVSLSSHQKLVIQILDKSGEFEKDSAVEIYAGSNKILTAFDAYQKTWTMVFDELPAYDTWIIVCRMNRDARNIQLGLRREGTSLIPLAFLSHDELTLTEDQTSAFSGHRTTPDPWWALVATGLAVSAYLARALDFSFDFSRLINLWAIDWLFMGIIVGLAGLLYLATRRTAPQITQGYWQPTVPEPIPSTITTPASKPDEDAATAGTA